MASMFNLAAVKNSLDEVRAQVYPRNETEKKVYEALSSKNWGASTSSLNELANDMFDFEKYKIITEIVWNNLNTEGKNWRQVFKTLTFIEFMIKNGSERFIEECRDRLHKIRSLQDYNFYEENMDRGSGVREKSKQVVELLNNNEAIRSEREKARALRNKFVGIDSRNAGGSGGFDNDRYSSGGRYDSYDTNPRRSEGLGSSGNSRRSSELSAGVGGRYGGGAYDSSRPPRYDDDAHLEEPAAPKAAVPSSKPSSTANNTATGGKLKMSIKKVATSAAPKAAEVDLMPTGGDVDLLGGFDSAPAPAAASAASFDPFGAATPAAVTSGSFAADFDPFGAAQGFVAPVNTSSAPPLFDPFAIPAAAPSTAFPSHAMVSSSFPSVTVPSPASAFPTVPVPAPQYASFNYGVPSVAPTASFAPPSQPQQSPQIHSMGAIAAQDAEFGDFEGAPQPIKPAPADNKWGDLAKLVDLSKIEKNETMAAKQQAATKPASSYDSFAGLDGFSKAPQIMSSGSNRPMNYMANPAQPAMMSRPAMGVAPGYPMMSAPGYPAPMMGAPTHGQPNSYPPGNMGMYNPANVPPIRGHMGAPLEYPMGAFPSQQGFGAPQQFRGGF